MTDTSTDELAGLRRVLQEALSEAPDAAVSQGAVELRRKFERVLERLGVVTRKRTDPAIRVVVVKREGD